MVSRDMWTLEWVEHEKKKNTQQEVHLIRCFTVAFIHVPETADISRYYLTVVCDVAPSVCVICVNLDLDVVTAKSLWVPASLKPSAKSSLITRF